MKKDEKIRTSAFFFFKVMKRGSFLVSLPGIPSLSKNSPFFKVKKKDGRYQHFTE